MAQEQIGLLDLLDKVGQDAFCLIPISVGSDREILIRVQLFRVESKQKADRHWKLFQLMRDQVHPDQVELERQIDEWELEQKELNPEYSDSYYAHWRVAFNTHPGNSCDIKSVFTIVVETLTDQEEETLTKNFMNELKEDDSFDCLLKSYKRCVLRLKQ